MLAVLYFTGPRRQEGFWLKWEQVDWSAKCIYVCTHSKFQVKEGREKVLPMAPALLEFLQQERQTYPVRYGCWMMATVSGCMRCRAL